MTPEEKSGTYVLSMPTAGLKKGDAVTVTLADCKAPKVRQLNKFFVLYTTPSAEKQSHTPKWAGGSVWADGNSDVAIRFFLKTDGGWEYAGWNIDDVLIREAPSNP